MKHLAEELVAEAERWIVRNAKLLAQFSQSELGGPPTAALPVK
ncbi:MAG: hypothetical protein NTY19_10975 [Planctomycetota bacterium]|nr:hypothetical protein [Planctomycetota bacterium]